MTFRSADESDCGLILRFIRLLAEYERMTDEVVATEDLIREWVFEKKIAETLFVMDGEKEVGFALFFHNFSTFLGRGGLYLEDLYVLPEYRGKGYGKALFTEVAKIANARGCGRMEWSCLNWNEKGIRFYESFGAVPMEGWTVWRLTGDGLKKTGTGSAPEEDGGPFETDRGARV